MKTTLFTVVCLIILSANAKAQNAFGVQAGGTFANQKYSGSGLDISVKTKVGITLGMVGTLAINKNFAFRPELNFTQKGGKSSSDDGGGSFTLNYIELPLNFVYRTSKDNKGLFIGAGPSLAFGISGKSKADGMEDEKINFGSSDDDEIKGLDLGAGVIVGYQFSKGVFLSANYNLGINNLAPGSDNGDFKMHNNYFAFKLGYMFK